jgi:malonyl CoA-acyl carrier protein transacylase
MARSIAAKEQSEHLAMDSAASKDSGCPGPVVAFGFAGQGSQRSGMGAELFSRHRETVRVANEVLGWSIEKLCLEKDGRLNRTEYTQPALFVVNSLYYRDFCERSGECATHLLGHSVGEYNALHAAGVMDFQTGLRIVKKRGEVMSRCRAEGAMAALIGPREQLLAFVDQNASSLYLANDNSPRQIVVAGGRESIAALEETVRRQNLGEVIPLAVSGAFHSPLMAEARDELAQFLAAQRFEAPSRCVIANVSASPYRSDNLVEMLIDHLVKPVRWLDSIRYLIARGPVLFQEIGPGRVLSSLFRQITADQARLSGGLK